MGHSNAGDPEFASLRQMKISIERKVGLALRDPNNHNGGEGPSNGPNRPSCSGMRRSPREQRPNAVLVEVIEVLTLVCRVA